MKLYKMIEISLKYDNMHTFGVINAFIYINNHVNSCINSMLSVAHMCVRMCMCARVRTSVISGLSIH